MSDILNKVWELTVEILTSKVPNQIPSQVAGRVAKCLNERLKDGDVTDEEIRRWVIRKIDAIKSKLDGLARKDLLSSLCFLQEGINRLFRSLPARENTEGLSAERVTLDIATPSTATGRDSTTNEAIALINDFTLFKICSNERFKSAIESFKLAREKATEAFCNEGLSVEDRIQASKIRILSRILESLDDPDASVGDCLQYLEQLHEIGAIPEMFSVLISGGIKAQFKQAKRLDNISSVQVMNQILFNFARNFMEVPTRTFDWPTILHGKEIYHPILKDFRLVDKLEESGVEVKQAYPDLTFDSRIYRALSAVNSEGQIVAHMLEESTIKSFKASGESRKVCGVPAKESLCECHVMALDIDAKDNIYFILRFQETDEEFWSFKLFMFDGNGNKKLESPLPFLQHICLKAAYMTINKDGDIAILDCEKKILYIGRAQIELNSFIVSNRFYVTELFTTESTWLNLRFSLNGKNLIAADERTVYIFAKNGKLQQNIKIFEDKGDEFIYSVAINHITKCIMIKTWSLTLGYRLLSFFETGKQINSLYLGPNKWIEYAKLISHPNGPAALVNDTGACIMKMVKGMNFD
ncbi:Deleted in malignant brain tumors 1 [Paramuricea clavata]|uniref:Deleted in malignant brain tumors 1 n=1 Tax=Paramuricea clavata TaxID=317549 RepID=A0A7D9LIM9_PARCT|nr:Deleted in malignant brain tumors 1 [Paramuricea clavata]